MADKGGVKLSSLPGNVYLLTLAGNGEHRFNPTSLAAINLALDEVEKDPNAAALVTTNEGKFFSNGLDLALFMKDPSQFDGTVLTLQQLLKRLLLFPIPAIAAICGHAAAGGCMFVLAQDYRYMSADRGYIFLSEIDVKLPLTPGMNALIQAKMHGKAFYKAVLSGYRFNGKSAAEHGFIEAALPDSASTLEEALKHAKALAARKFHRPTYKAMKMEMFKTVVRELDEGGNPTSINELLSRL